MEKNVLLSYSVCSIIRLFFQISGNKLFMITNIINE